MIKCFLTNFKKKVLLSFIHGSEYNNNFLTLLHKS